MSALIWLLVCPGLHAAKPTRTLTRPPARLVATPSSHRSARDWSMHPAAGSSTHRAARATEPTVRTSARKASSRDFLQAAHPAAVVFDRRDHAWQRAQRDAAARDAIRAVARTTSSLATTRLPGDGTATGDEDSPAIASAPVVPPIQSIGEASSTPALLPPLRIASLYDSRGRLVVPPPLYGSREILLHQNLMADREGLDRVQDDDALLDLLREKKLVALPIGETLRVDERLPENRRYSRPWTSAFLVSFSRDFYSIFHSPLQVNSAVRTVAFQQRLLRTNGNAASFPSPRSPGCAPTSAHSSTRARSTSRRSSNRPASTSASTRTTFLRSRASPRPPLGNSQPRHSQKGQAIESLLPVT